MSTPHGQKTPGNRAYPAAYERARRQSDGCATLSHRDRHGVWREISLDHGATRMTIGRSESADIIVAADATVSRLHAIIERVGGCWIVIDNGLSMNGTFVNGERVSGFRKLESGDTVRLGKSVFVFTDGSPSEDEKTIVQVRLPTRNSLTDAQYSILEALCRPYDSETAFTYPASNWQIAHDLCLSVATVKTHMRALFKIFDVEALPPNQKRVFLVERAMESGVIDYHDR
ncbi:regulatory protein, luxR family [Nocardia amikacinitolerans]|uniref:FHA domain-containing protein n=1 Tax=Nocardia amikacinitolerans TaxID=756689 RepID=UPI0009FDA0E0|nr:FHA domain-containing protein [Nocardia amikacinitolerans]MCP2315719.1 regulatory protein, luxR family [Nocardia amikacinitolerans]